jgi:hypothetical protein
MAGASQFRRTIHQALSLALVLLFGPAPFASLLALPSGPECKMACCERKHNSSSCPRHQPIASDAASVQLVASTGCPPDCSRAAAGPSLSGQVLITAGTAIRVPSTGLRQTHSIPAPSLRWAFDPTLYQRPPPLPV